MTTTHFDPMHLVRAWRVEYPDGAVRHKVTYRLDPVLGGSFTPPATIDPLPGVDYSETVRCPFPLGDVSRYEHEGDPAVLPDATGAITEQP